MDHLAGRGVRPRRRRDAPGRLLPARRSRSARRSPRSSACSASARCCRRSCSSPPRGSCSRTLRPVARRHRRLPPAIRTGAAALVGRARDGARADRQRRGRRLREDRGGEVWTARSYDEDEVIDAGERVEVVEITGRDGARDALSRRRPKANEKGNRTMVALIVVAVVVAVRAGRRRAHDPRDPAGPRGGGRAARPLQPHARAGADDRHAVHRPRASRSWTCASRSSTSRRSR